MDRRSSLYKNASSFSRKSTLDFVIVLNLCIDSSSLFVFRAKKAIPDIWTSNWNWVFTHFNVVHWLYVVKFRESSRIRMRRFLKPRKKNIRSSFWINLIHKCRDIYDIEFLYIQNFVILEWLFCMFKLSFVTNYAHCMLLLTR